MIQKTLIALSLLLLSSMLIMAQPEDRMNKVRAQKAAYITQRLDLSVETSQAFWPIYNEYEEKLIALKNERHKNKRKDLDSMSDDELKASMNKWFELEEQELELKQEYHKKYLKLLTPLQVAQLYDAEHDFRRELLNRLKDRSSRGRDGKGY